MLTKSDFTKYIQCIKYLWLAKYRKDLIPPTDPNLQKVFDEGYEVEKLANNFFPNAVNAQVGGFAQSIANTTRLMQRKASSIIQPTISSNNLFCRGDIVKYNEDGSWDIFEVKSSTEVKEMHIFDLAFQKICFEKAGHKINKLYVIFVNKEYVRQGEINIHEFLKVEDVTEQVMYSIEEMGERVQEALEILKQRDEPSVRILKQCRSPYACSFLDHCWKDIPKSSIYDISRNLNETKLNMLIDEGIIRIKDIPDGLFKSEMDLKHHHAAKHDTVHIEAENIQTELNSLEYPLYFLDYETYSSAVPLFDGTRPYQQVPFQYSLHVQKEPGGPLEHYEYLAHEFEEPSKKLAMHLSKRIGEKGSVIVWYAPFETGRNSEMGEMHPEFAELFDNVNARVYDLMMIFKKGYYVHKDFYCSASIKKVLPVVVPELSYKGLGIQEGATALNSWGEMIKMDTPDERKEQIYNDLLKYCELDTLAMVKILEKLREIE